MWKKYDAKVLEMMNLDWEWWPKLSNGSIVTGWTHKIVPVLLLFLFYTENHHHTFLLIYVLKSVISDPYR